MTEMMTMIAEAISHQPHHQQFWQPCYEKDSWWQVQMTVVYRVYCQGQLMTGTDDCCLQGILKIHKMFHFVPNEENKSVTMRKCRVCSENKWRK
jgi:hypothetical protein